MTRTPVGGFFERAVTIHRYDCEAVSVDDQPTGGGPAADIDAACFALDEAVVGYAVAARPLYDGMRRSIGQVAGLLVLVQASGRRDVLDLPELAVAGERWDELAQRLRTLKVPRGLEPHFDRLERAHAMIGDVLDAFYAARRTRGWQSSLDRASETIKSAYACLQAASEPRAGMTMVDFNHACCSCARRWRQEGGSNGPVFDMGA